MVSFAHVGVPMDSEVLERFWIANKDIHMLSEGTCDSELGSYPVR